MDDGCWISRSCKAWRRGRALHLQRAGWKRRDIATVLEVTEGAVSQWLAMAREGGAAALDSRASPGRPPHLTPAQKHLIPDFLWHGTEAYGFRGELWTWGRVTEGVAEALGVSYRKSQVSRLLKALGWTPRVPITRAIQRDEAAITRWRREVWPQLEERAQRERRVLLCVDESGFYRLPGVVETYAPQGLTPGVYEWQSRDHLSVRGGITLPGKGSTWVRQVALNGLHAVMLLEQLLRAAGQRLRGVWDRSPIQRRHDVQECLSATGAGSLHLEVLPPYAPDLNPTAWAWQHSKHAAMRHRVCLDLEELHMELYLAIGRVRQKPHWVRSFFAGAGLDL